MASVPQVVDGEARQRTVFVGDDVGRTRLIVEDRHLAERHAGAQRRQAAAPS